MKLLFNNFLMILHQNNLLIFILEIFMYSIIIPLDLKLVNQLNHFLLFNYQLKIYFLNQILMNFYLFFLVHHPYFLLLILHNFL